MLLTTLEERVSVAGTPYLTGRLGNARVIAYLDRDAPEGMKVWQIFVRASESRPQRVDRQ